MQRPLTKEGTLQTSFVRAGQTKQTASAAPDRSAALRLIGPFAALHLLMLLYDAWHPDRFLNADRAVERLDVIRSFGETLQAGGDIAGFLAAHGIAGDWLPQALLYLMGGQYLVVAVQSLLALLSILCVRDIGMQLGLGSGKASAAAVLYGLLPQSLVFPHQLAAEAISVPLIIVSFSLCVSSKAVKEQAAGGALMGLATMVRPITMLWPLVYASLAPLQLGARFAYLLAALAPLALWTCFIYAETTAVSMGTSGHDLGHNLYARVYRMNTTLPASERSPSYLQRDGSIGVGDYGSFVLDHPAAALAHTSRDLVMFGLKSGLERLVLDYLDLFPDKRLALQDPDTGWQTQMEQQGFLVTLVGTLRNSPGPMITTAVGAFLFAIVTLLAAIGAFTWLRRDVPKATYRLRFVLLVFVLYIAATAQTVEAVQSRQRAPVEFVLCLLAVSAWPRPRR